jgi:hypothetical protein
MPTKTSFSDLNGGGHYTDDLLDGMECSNIFALSMTILMASVGEQS